MEVSGKTIIHLMFFAACAALFVALYLGAWCLRRMLPEGHPATSMLSAEGVLHAAKVLGAALIAAYFAGAVILYG